VRSASTAIARDGVTGAKRTTWQRDTIVGSTAS